jgi:hypothetical protein
LDFGLGNDWFYLPWLAVANSFSMDWLARSRLTSPKMAFSLLDSLPFPRPALADALVQNVAPIVLRLICTSLEMSPFWNRMADLGFVEAVAVDTIPGSALVNPIDRAIAKADLDAFVAIKVFSLTKGELSDLLETFDVLQRREQKAYGEFRTKKLILQAFEALSSAGNSGQPYRSLLSQRQVRPADEPGGWTLAQLADRKVPEFPFTLVATEHEVGNASPKRWRCLAVSDANGRPDADTWVLVRHPALKRGDTAVPIALGKMSYQELTDARTKKKVVVLTLRGPVPPAQVRIPLSEWPAFRPLAVLEPLDS